MDIRFFSHADNQPPLCGFLIRFFSHADNEPTTQLEPIPPSGTGNRNNQFKSFSLADEQFLRNNWQKMTNEEMARALGRTMASITSKGSQLKLIKNKAARYMAACKSQLKKENTYQEWEKQYLRDNWQFKTRIEIAVHLGRTWGSIKSQGRKLGLFKTAESIREIVKRPNAGQFKKGQLPSNTIYGDELVIRTRYNKNRRPYKWIRIGLGKWQEYHRWLWIQEKGPIPEEHIIIFRNKDTLDVRIDNLEMITMTENAIRNAGSIHLTDTYVAAIMSVRKPELRAELINHPELIDLKRTQINLNRAIKHDNSKPRKTRRPHKNDDGQNVSR